MNSEPDIAWELVREIGPQYAARNDSASELDLICPLVVEAMPEGVLVVDEVASDALPPRVKCRTILLSPDRRVVYDSTAHGQDGYGCRMENGLFAILRHELRDLLVLFPDGRVIQRIDLAGVSSNRPWLLSRTDRETFLIAFLPGSSPLQIVEIDSHGRLLWRCPEANKVVSLPGSMQLLPDDSILIADEFLHVLIRLERDGSNSIRWGSPRSPSEAIEHLSRPRWARQLDDGTLLVADAHNHRILVINGDSQATQLNVTGCALIAPSSVVRLANGNYLVADAGNRCLVELNREGHVVWYLGPRMIEKRSFSFPRSVQYFGGRYLIADTAHNRNIEIDDNRWSDLPLLDGVKLFWPRAVRNTPHETLLVADGRGSRIVEVSREGRLLRQLHRIEYRDRRIELRDPHDVRLLDNGRLLVVDSAASLVFESDWSGRAAWVLGLKNDIGLKDPHSAQLLEDGRVMVVDSLNDRILFVETHRCSWTSVTKFEAKGKVWKFNHPRYAEKTRDGSLVVVDSGNHRVLISKPGRAAVWEFSNIPASPISFLRFPRWAQLFGRDELIVSDHANHRILHLRRIPS